MPAHNFEAITNHVLLKLEGLSPMLTYHCTGHTMDVIKHAERIALDEGINKKEIYLLKVAALYHDTGFLYAYAGHEKKSWDIFLQDADEFSFDEEDKKKIVELIMATKMPQQPKTLLQKIICDADLDYLGRNDFMETANRLKNEFLNYAMVADEEEWKNVELKFLKDHHYHTPSSQLLREPVKQKNYQLLQK